MRERICTKEEMIKIDIGCGQKKREGYIGVDDWSEKMFKMNQRDIAASAYNLPFKDNSVDEVYSAGCLELEVSLKATTEVLRVLKPKGKMIIRMQDDSELQTIDAILEYINNRIEFMKQYPLRLKKITVGKRNGEVEYVETEDEKI